MVAPPPLLFLAGYAAGLLVSLLVPLPLPSSSLLVGIGAVLVLAGLSAAGAAALTMRRAGTELEPGATATALVMAGPYRWSRNPIYTGTTVAYVGIALATANLWPIIMLVGVLLTLYYGVVLREERYLGDRFGAEYQRYRQRVRRFI